MLTFVPWYQYDKPMMRYKMIFLLVLMLLGDNLSVKAQQKGKATFYTRKWEGRKTASGERLYNDSLVCAHKTHKFGTLLKVKNPANGKEVVVKVIDRGPYVGILSQGVAVVEVSLYRKPTDIPYEPEPEDIPEINLETTKGESIIPQWQDSVVTNQNKRRP